MSTRYPCYLENKKKINLSFGRCSVNSSSNDNNNKTTKSKNKNERGKREEKMAESFMYQRILLNLFLILYVRKGQCVG